MNNKYQGIGGLLRFAMASKFDAALWFVNHRYEYLESNYDQIRDGSFKYTAFDYVFLNKFKFKDYKTRDKHRFESKFAFSFNSPIVQTLLENGYVFGKKSDIYPYAKYEFTLFKPEKMFYSKEHDILAIKDGELKRIYFDTINTLDKQMNNILDINISPNRATSIYKTAMATIERLIVRHYYSVFRETEIMDIPELINFSFDRFDIFTKIFETLELNKDVLIENFIQHYIDLKPTLDLKLEDVSRFKFEGEQHEYLKHILSLYMDQKSIDKIYGYYNLGFNGKEIARLLQNKDIPDVSYMELPTLG